MLSATAMFGAALVAPGAALAQFPPPPGLAGPPPGVAPGGLPPGLGAGGPLPGGTPQPHLAGLAPRDLAGAAPRDFAGASPHFQRSAGAAGLQGLDRGGGANFRGADGRAVSYGRNGYAGHGYGYRYWRYAAAAAYANGGSRAASDDGCYYVSASRRTAPGAFWSVPETDRHTRPWRPVSAGRFFAQCDISGATVILGLDPELNYTV